MEELESLEARSGFINCSKGEAGRWRNITNAGNYSQFEEMFLKKYWSAKIQQEVMTFGPEDYLENYCLTWSVHAQYFDNDMGEEWSVKHIENHFPQRVLTVDSLIKILAGLSLY